MLYGSIDCGRRSKVPCAVGLAHRELVVPTARSTAGVAINYTYKGEINGSVRLATTAYMQATLSGP